MLARYKEKGRLSRKHPWRPFSTVSRTGMGAVQDRRYIMKSSPLNLHSQQQRPQASTQNVQKRLTPLGALPRLQRDERENQLHTSDHALLKILIQLCDKLTGEVRLPLREIARRCSWKSERSARRHLKYLDELNIITYLPGCGRGVKARVFLLFETWGQPEKKGTLVSPFSGSASKVRAREKVPMKEVECTQPFSEQPSQVAPRRATYTQEFFHWVKKFHGRSHTPSHKLNDSFLNQERERVHRIFAEYPSNIRERAWKALWQYYERATRRAKPRSIALWEFYCKHIEEITKEFQRVERLQTLHRRRMEKRGRKGQQTRRETSQTPVQPDWYAENGEERRDKHESLAHATDAARLRQTTVEDVDKPDRPAFMYPQHPPDGASPVIWSEWVEAMNRLRGMIQASPFETWIRPLVPVARKGNAWTVYVPHAFGVCWIEKNYLSDIVEVLGRGAQVHLCVQGE